MTKFSVTNELADVIKTMRTQSKITSKKLAAHIEKSPSYISKLEGGEISKILEEELTAIFEYIVEGEDFYADKLPAIIRTFSSFQALETMPQQIWLLHYDTLRRPIVLSAQMIDDIKARIDRLGLNARELAEKVNANKDSAMSTAFPANELIEYVFRENRLLLIRMEVQENEIAALLDKKQLTVNYCWIHGLMFTILRVEDYGEQELTAEYAERALLNTRQYLERFGVYSLTELNRLMSAANSMENQLDLLSAFSAINVEILEQILTSFRLASEHDVLNTAQVLEEFRKNLAWDQAFMLKLISQPFYRLNNISFSLKKQLLEEIIALTEKYTGIPEYKKTIEIY